MHYQELDSSQLLDISIVIVCDTKYSDQNLSFDSRDTILKHDYLSLNVLKCFWRLMIHVQNASMSQNFKIPSGEIPSALKPKLHF